MGSTPVSPCQRDSCGSGQAYANNLVDYHLIMDLVPSLAAAFFAGSIPVTLSAGQAAILLCLGLQHTNVAMVEQALGLPGQQVLALFNKVGWLASSLHCTDSLLDVGWKHCWSSAGNKTVPVGLDGF